MKLDDCPIPVEIKENETILRVLKTTFHFKPNGDVKWQAFKPQRGERDVSVIRQEIGSNPCKLKAKEICAKSVAGEYYGFAALLAQKITEIGCGITDSRSEFCGHADLSHGHRVADDNEPNDPQIMEDITNRCKQILASVTIHRDPDPNSNIWNGGELKLTP